MIELREAYQRIDGAVTALEPETIPIREAVGCVLARPIQASIDVPRFATSVMDGVAIRLGDLHGEGPWRLAVQGTLGAGQNPCVPLSPGRACKIMTGAPLVEGADTVVRIEDVRLEGSDVVITERPEKGSYVRPPADDIKAGDRLFEAGDTFTPVDAGVVASVGLSSVDVVPRPRVALLITGSELIQPGTALAHGQRYDSNLVALELLLGRAGFNAKTVIHGIRDDPGAVAKALEGSLDHHDLIVSTGGVSVGDYDYVPRVVRELGGEVLFHGVDVKPGRPVIMARLRDAWFIGLPGNPVSVVCGYHLYVRRTAARMMGSDYKPRASAARLLADLTVGGSRFCVVGARIDDTAGEIRALPACRQESGRLSAVKGINGFLMLDKPLRSLKKGDRVPAEWLD